MKISSAASVLIIESEHNTRVFLRKVLERQGLQVLSTATGENVYKLLFQEPRPRMIFLGDHLPLLETDDFADKLRTDPYCAHIPIVRLGKPDAQKGIENLSLPLYEEAVLTLLKKYLL